MAEWIYRANESGADSETTIDLLLSHKFFNCTAFGNIGQWIANVQHVRGGDILHIVFSRSHPRGVIYETIGSFEILNISHADHDTWIENHAGDPIPLFRVKQGTSLEEYLKQTTYERDPVLKSYTGWHVREDDIPMLDTDSVSFRGLGSLQAMTQEDRKDRFTKIGSFGKQMLVPVAELDAAGVVPSTTPTVIPSETTAVASTIRFPKSGRALGVDWSGAAKAGNKIWAAAVRFDGLNSSRLNSVGRPFKDRTAAVVAADFSSWLMAQEFDVAGLDFCFGLSAKHQLPGCPQAGPGALGRWLAKRYNTPDQFRAAIGREYKRQTDRYRRTKFAPTNLRMYRQTFWGLRALAGVTLPILPWGKPSGRVVVEVLPAHVATALSPHVRYKGRGADERAGRDQLVGTLESVCGMKIAHSDREKIVSDSEGDALDAVLAAVAAAVAKESGFRRPLMDDANEGWIYSVE